MSTLPHRQRGWPELKPVALHGVVGEIVRTIEPHSEADRAVILGDLLASAGNAIGPGPHVVADSARHPARLHILAVGATARARKGTARNNAARVMEHADEGWARDRVVSGLASGEGLIAAVADPMQDENGRVTGGSADRRLLVVETEFARTLSVAGRDGNTLSAVVRQAWDSGDLRVMTRKEPLKATGAHVSIIGHITVEELRRCLTSTEVANGFANRFILLAARRSKLLPAGGGLQDEDFERLGRLLRTQVQQARGIGRVRRSGEAEVLWATMYEELADSDGTGLVHAVTARAEAQLLRLSMTYALLDASPVILPEHLQAAWAVWEYAADSAAYIFGGAMGDEVADRLLAALQHAGEEGLDGTAQRDLFFRHVLAERLEAARAELGKRGDIVTIRTPTGGRSRLRSFAAAYAPKAT